MSSAMHLKAAAFLWACVSAASAAQAPQRIVSADLCADVYVLALAEPADIAAISWQAGQAVSAAPAWALDLPRASSDAENLIALQPDLVVFGAAGAGEAGRFLDAAGIAHVSVGWGEDFATVLANLETVGGAIGRQAQAARLAADLTARRNRLSARAAERSHSPSVYYLSVTGGAAGAGTLVDEAIRMAGGRNAAAEAGAVGWQPADAEWALRVHPDLVITSYFTDGYATRSDLGARHSAFRRLLNAAPHLEIPSSAWSCAGPGLLDAAEAIADRLDDMEPGS